MAAARPVVGLVCDHRMMDGYPFHMVAEPYIAAVRDGSGALPLLIPALDPALSANEVIAGVDGFLFPGSASNVSPRRYGGPTARDPSHEDLRRDETALALQRAAVAAGKPVLCICRGFQELNVTFGGTLHQQLHEVPGRLDHREDDKATLDAQFAPAHEVTVAEGGLLARIVSARRFRVNSLHGQGVDRLAPPFHADALAPDGQIEAVSMPEAKGFLLGVQWHPEWRWAENEISRAIFAAFGVALRNSADCASLPRQRKP